MPEVEETQPAADNSDTDSNTGQDTELLSGLPDDPVERAKELESRVLASTRENRNLKTETERLARERDEQASRGDHWYDEWERTAKKPVAAGETDAPPAKTTKIEQRDLAEFVGDEEEGYSKLAARIKEDLKLVTRDELNQEFTTQRTAAQRAQAITSRLTQDYPDLGEADSPLRVEAGKQFQALEREHPTWDNEAIGELAVTRAARKIGVQPGKPSNNDDGNSRARGAFASQGRKPSGGKAPVGQVDDRLRKTAAKTAGEALPDSVLKRVADTVAATQAESRRRGLA